MQPHPDRRSVISLSAILIAAIAYAILTLILAPQFFAGAFRGSYHYWVIASRLVVWIGAAMLLPALIFYRARQFALAALMLILFVTFILLGNRGAMQYRLGWQSTDAHYYTVTDHLYLPPFDTQLHVYMVECNNRDLQCQSTPITAVTHDSWIDPDLDEGDGAGVILCRRTPPRPTCDRVFDLPPGTPIYPVAPPD